METAWLFDTLSVTVTRIDFLDPAFASAPDTRERGVRVEIRPVDSSHVGTIYASPTVTMHPAVCRIDLLESSPGAADRMHWHPTMPAGEPGDRVFDPAIPADPLGWLADRLADVRGLLTLAGVGDVSRHTESAKLVAENEADIVAAAGSGLQWARGPWPDVCHDKRGMAISPPSPVAQ
ncbi:MAG: hypothetical protein ABI720_00250 [Actinomycetes bacterium]